jgi:ubiquinone/menaquinone biosynthesis C-methylase UbiE
MKLNWGERLAVNNPIRPWQQRFELSLLKDHIPLEPGAHILEVGCGRGAGALLINSRFHPAHLYATDLDAEMIRMAFAYLSPGDRRGITFLAADASQLPFPDGSMDAVFGFGVLHHIPDWQAALVEIVRVLAPGGVYFFEELFPTLYQNFITKHILLHPTENRFHSIELKEAMRQTGLTLRKFFEFPLMEIFGVATKH